MFLREAGAGDRLDPELGGDFGADRDLGQELGLDRDRAGDGVLLMDDYGRAGLESLALGSPEVDLEPRQEQEEREPHVGQELDERAEGQPEREVLERLATVRLVAAEAEFTSGIAVM